MRGSAFIVGIAAATAGVALLAAYSTSAHADPEPQPGWREVWTGADVASHVWLIYSGATVAPYGHIYSDGLRLRVAGGYGQYSYTGERRGEVVSFNAETSYGEALIGYQKRFGELTAKAFVGIAAIDHDVAPYDPENGAQGLEFGPKLASELWLNVGTSGWSSLDLSWTSAHNTAAARLRGGYRIYGDVSLGLEGGFNSTNFGDDTRGGAFVRYGWTGGEISLSGGFSGRFLEEASTLRDPYATANWLTQF
jgi:hypothetical protein